MTKLPPDLQAKCDEMAEEFERDVYMADPEMVDSNPAKLYSYGFTAAYELMSATLKTFKEADTKWRLLYELVGCHCKELTAENERLKKALKSIDQQLKEGFLVCVLCRNEASLKDLDVRLEIKEAIGGAE